MLENRTLIILQYNVNKFKSKIIILLFKSKDITNFNILIIQKV